MVNNDLFGINSSRKKFIEIVAKHVQHDLDPIELEALTIMAQCNAPYAAGLCFEAFDSVENRVRHLAFEETISPLDMLSVPYFFQRLQVIAQLQGRPVFYFKKTGIYLWSLEPGGDSLSVWLSHPAYPPGWPQADDTQLETPLESGRVAQIFPLPC